MVSLIVCIMAHITALLGPPPLDFLERSRSKRRQEYYDPKGRCINLIHLSLNGYPEYRSCKWHPTTSSL